MTSLKHFLNRFSGFLYFPQQKFVKLTPIANWMESVFLFIPLRLGVFA